MKIKPGVYHLRVRRLTTTESINYAVMSQNKHYATLIVKQGELNHREMRLCGVSFEKFKEN